MSPKKKSNKEIVFIPLISSYTHAIEPFKDNEIADSKVLLNLSDGTKSGIDIIILDQFCYLGRGGVTIEKKFRIDSKIFKIKDIFSDESYRFRAGLKFYMRKKDDGLMVFPHQFEDKIRSVIHLLRIFSPGDVFAPFALVNNFDVSRIFSFGQFEEEQDGMSISESNLTKFKDFYEHYVQVFSQVWEGAQSDNKQLSSWARRINNSIFFFNSSYFSQKSNTIRQGFRSGNNTRLINLITTIDSLCGFDSSKKRLSDNCHLLIGKIYPKIKDRIEYFYDLRSNYVHANPNKLVTLISDKDIKELKLYAQKLILINLELFSSEEFKKPFLSSGLTHYFEYLKKGNGIAIEILERAYNWQDLYEWPYATDVTLKRLKLDNEKAQKKK